MARAKTAYVCADCGAHSVKWQGQCPECAAWNTLTQTTVSASQSERPEGVSPSLLASLSDDLGIRHATGFSEFDRVLGGGLVPGSVVLLGGDPGVGKSTLLQQVAARLPQSLSVCYASGEESLRQIGQRSRRLGLDRPGMSLLADTSLDNILEQAKANSVAVLVIDSIQTTATLDLPSAPGSVAQLRECVGRIVQFAKQREVAVFLIGHVTKEGAIAGPRVVEHMVDTVLYFESDPEILKVPEASGSDNKSRRSGIRPSALRRPVPRSKLSGLSASTNLPLAVNGPVIEADVAVRFIFSNRTLWSRPRS